MSNRLLDIVRIYIQILQLNELIFAQAYFLLLFFIEMVQLLVFLDIISVGSADLFLVVQHVLELQLVVFASKSTLFDF